MIFPAWLGDCAAAGAPPSVVEVVDRVSVEADANDWAVCVADLETRVMVEADVVLTVDPRMCPDE